MMKKIFAVLLTGLMAVSVAACSNNNANNNSGTNSQPSVVAEGSKLAEITKTDSTKDDYLTDTKLYNCFYSKSTEENVRITLSGDVDINGSKMSIDMDMQKQGDNKYVSMKMMGMNTVNISKDGYTYSLNSVTKTYTKTENQTSSDDDMADSLESLTGSLKEVTFIENGVSNEDGTTDYEKYSSAASTMTCYFDGDQIKFIDIEQEATTSNAASQKVRLNFSVTNDIDATLFEIPEGYTEASGNDMEISLADGVSLIEDAEE